MEFNIENIQKHIPVYLTAEERGIMFAELRAIASSGTAAGAWSMRHESYKNTMLQGDGWHGFRLFEFKTNKPRSVKGIVLSNSCDVDADNQRDYPPRVVFAPLVELSLYRNLLEQGGAPAVEDKIRSIKAQRVTNVFYIPAGGALKDDHVVRLDEIHSMPMAAHNARPDRKKLFTLSNTGFYMLTFKLSVHFCRLQENVDRGPGGRAA